MMEVTKATRTCSKLKNGAVQVLTHGQLDFYFFKVVLLLAPTNATTKFDYSLFMELILHNYLDTGFRFQMLPSGEPYYKLAPTSRPQHRVHMDSDVFRKRGKFEALHDSFGGKLELDSLIVERGIFYFSLNLTKTYVTWLHDTQEDMQVLFQCDLFDLRPTQFLKTRCRRAWVTERTMTRKMARKLTQLIGEPVKRYKGVRWRPERKHPWIAEIKLSKSSKKIWIGNFDTPKEAARAYDLVAIHHKLRTPLNFMDSLEYASRPAMSSTAFSRIDTSYPSVGAPSSLSYEPLKNLETSEGHLLTSAVLMTPSSNQDWSMNDLLDSNGCHVSSNPKENVSEDWTTLFGGDHSFEDISPFFSSNSFVEGMSTTFQNTVSYSPNIEEFLLFPEEQEDVARAKILETLEPSNESLGP
jgi:hypothetical protein